MLTRNIQPDVSGGIQPMVHCDRFPVVMRLEIVGHIYEPCRHVTNLFGLLEPGVAIIISTYTKRLLKNLAMMLTDKPHRTLESSAHHVLVNPKTKQVVARGNMHRTSIANQASNHYRL